LIKTHYARISVFAVILMISGFIPLVASPMSSPEATNTSYSPSAFTWETFNKDMNVTTFASPDGSHDTLWHFLNSAQQSIYVEIFGINNPYLLDLIHELHITKPALDMKFLIGWDSLGYQSENKYVANNLTLLGYPVKWTNKTEFAFAHQKFVIIDNKTTIVQSGNWAKTSFPEAGMKANREWNIAMTDIEVTHYYRDVFDYDWENGITYNPAADGTGTALTYSESSSTYPRPFATDGTFSGQMKVTPIFSPDTSLQGILYCINSAQATLDIQIPYFTNYNDGNAVTQILDAIIAAKNRGVTVRVITEETYDFVEVAALLHQHNIPVVWQDTRWFTALHNKGIVVDGRIVLISSINYSDGSISENREAGVIIENEEVAQWYQNVYDFDWGLGDCDVMSEVNLYWTPNIPTSATPINVTVYTHMLYSAPVTSVSLGVKIGSGAWNNYSITANVFDSSEGDPENYFYVIPAQADGENITVQATVVAASVTHVGEEMVIRVRNSIGSITTTTTTTVDPIVQLLIELAPYIAVAIVVAVAGLFAKKRR
jgi:phosphatidylserine/phosphatidylglycerophosphate/cardiolipin synthase-like enzyme